MSDTPQTDAAKINVFSDWSGYYMETQDGSHYEGDLVSSAAAKDLERQRDAYAETLKGTLRLLDEVRSVDYPARLAQIIRERHPELPKP